MEQMGRMRQMGWTGSKGVENSCVILFLNLGKFRYIWDCSFVQPLYLATFVSRDTFLLRRGLGRFFKQQHRHTTSL